MPFILETVVTTLGPEGRPHTAPYGLIQSGEGWILAPFRPSPAIANLQAHPFAVAAAPRDMRVIAGAVTGRRDWPLSAGEAVPCPGLAEAYGRLELAAERFEEDAVRPRFHCRVVKAASLAPFCGYNRAQAAVLEAAILATRLDRLPREKLESELEYLSIALSKTAGAAEMEGWEWITEKIRAHYGGRVRIPGEG